MIVTLYVTLYFLVVMRKAISLYIKRSKSNPGPVEVHGFLISTDNDPYPVSAPKLKLNTSHKLPELSCLRNYVCMYV